MVRPSRFMVKKRQSLIACRPSTTGGGSTCAAWDIVREIRSGRVSAKQPKCRQNVGRGGWFLNPGHVRIGRMRLLGALVAGIDHERDAPSPEFKRNRVAWPVAQFGVQNGHVRIQVG